MRVLAVRGANLASLAGPFEVELARPPLAKLGLFAITGPTGAGKSTLLDALCLALYGKTPRHGGRGGVTLGAGPGMAADTLSANDPRVLARRGASLAFAEVDFVGADGRGWRARWQVRRARGQALGRLQAEELSLVALEGGERLGEGKLGTLAEIEGKVGLSYDEFCRSVLLAQGGFAAFLEADAAERATLLEKITGTGIYGELSRAAHERARGEREALVQAERELAARAPLDAAARAARERALAESEDARVRAGAVLARVQRAAAALSALRQATQALARAQADHVTATKAELAARERSAAAYEAAVRALRDQEEAQPQLLRAHLLDEQLAQSETPRLRAALGEARVAAQQAAAALAALEEGAALPRPEGARRGGLKAAGGSALDEAVAALARAQAERQAAAADRSRLGQARQRHAALVDRQRETHARHARAATDAQHELAALGLTVDLAAARAALVEGEPCPLCGSTEHPALRQSMAAGAGGPSDLERATAVLVLVQRALAEETTAQTALADATETLGALVQSEALATTQLGHKEEALTRARQAALANAREAEASSAAAVEALARELFMTEAAERGSRDERASLFSGAAATGVRARLGAALAHVQQDERQAHAAHAGAQASLAEAARRVGEAQAAVAVAERDRAQHVDEGGDAGDEPSARAAYHAATERWGQERAALLADDEARARAAELGPRIAEQRARVELWGALDQLIGSADGSRLRVFAQSLTLDALLHHANAQLAQLAPRYRLLRIEPEGERRARFDLELAVRDLESGGEVRHTSSLSGGERFLVSLALALGLSSLSAQKTRVESLFIDEGFSSLDPETLEVALAAFEALRATGRQIGVISHVPALAERIGSQVRVVKISEGRSRLVVGAG